MVIIKFIFEIKRVKYAELRDNNIQITVYYVVYLSGFRKKQKRTVHNVKIDYIVSIKTCFEKIVRNIKIDDDRL